MSFLKEVPIKIDKGNLVVKFPKKFLDEFGEVSIRKVGNLLVVEKPKDRIKSTVTLTIFRPDNTIRDQQVINTIVDTGHEWLADAASDRFEESMRWMGVGDTSGGKSSASVALENELVRRSIILTHLTGADSKKVRFTVYIEAGVATTTLEEAGLFNATTGGTMFAYTEFSQVKAIAEALQIDWDIEF